MNTPQTPGGSPPLRPAHMPDGSAPAPRTPTPESPERAAAARRAVLLRVALALTALLVLVAIVHVLQPAPAAPEPMICETDDTSRTSPGFSRTTDDAVLQRLDGTPVMLHELAGPRLTVLVFCSASCPCSDGYTERLASLERTYESRGVRFIGVHANALEDADDMKRYISRRSYPLEVYRDADCVVADMLGARVTPEAFVFDATWTLHYQGRIDDDKGGHAVRDPSLQRALDTLLTGAQLRVREKASLGCAIVRPS